MCRLKKYTMKPNNILIPILLGFALVLGISIGSFLNFPVKPISLAQSDEREMKLRQIMDYINYEYVDQVDTDSLLDLTIEDLVKKLDPHSTYIPRELAERSEETMRGSFEGIGIEFKIFRDTLTVIHAIEGGPSSRAGIKQGDRILMAGNKVLFGEEVTSREVISTLKGESGTQVMLDVYRPQEKTTKRIEVQRDAVAINSVQMNFMLNENTGYVKLLRFAQTSADELRSALADLRSQGAKKLVLDLRDNPGGLMVSAREIADEFIEDDRLIVFTRDRKGNMRNFESSSRGAWEKGELVVLINENSASASEIVAGAVQDNDRGWIVGRRSFGKGLVQEEITLEDGSRLRLTTQRYFTPSGRSIQKPFDSYEGYHHDAYLGGDGSFQTSADQEHQLFYTRGGRKVYGGGGINPDYRVERDTSQRRAYVYHLGMITSFDEEAFAYIDANRKEFDDWSEENFVANYRVDEELLRHFFGVHTDNILDQPALTQQLIRDRIKAFMAYNLYGSAAFQRIYAQYDPYLERALTVMGKHEL